MKKETKLQMAILYARFSPRPNAKKCKSNDTQLQLLREHCKSNGIEIVEELVDRAKSRNDKNRLGLHAAIAAIKKGYILLAYAPDRIGSGFYLQRVMYDVEERGGSVQCVTGWNNEDNPEGRFFRAMIAAAKEYDRDAAASRTGEMVRAMQRSGHSVGGREPPYGWKVVGDKLLEEVPEEQRVIREILYWYQAGKSAYWIANKLSIEGVQIRGRTIWYDTTVKAIIARSECVKTGRKRKRVE